MDHNGFFDALKAGTIANLYLLEGTEEYIKAQALARLCQVLLPEGMEATHVEVGALRYRRVFTLSKELDPEKAVAEFAKGVLKLRIPKASRAQPRKVEIRVE